MRLERIHMRPRLLQLLNTRQYLRFQQHALGSRLNPVMHLFLIMLQMKDLPLNIEFFLRRFVALMLEFLNPIVQMDLLRPHLFDAQLQVV